MSSYIIWDAMLYVIKATSTYVTYEGNLMTLDKLEETLERTKNWKATEQDGLNTELVKYGGTLLKLRILHFYNMCKRQKDIPQDWYFSEKKTELM